MHAAIELFYSQFLAQHMTDETMRYFAQGNERVIAAHLPLDNEGRVLVGMAAYRFGDSNRPLVYTPGGEIDEQSRFYTTNTVLLDYIAIDRMQRRRSIGGQIIRYVIRDAQSYGMRYLEAYDTHGTPGFFYSVGFVALESAGEGYYVLDIPSAPHDS